MKLAHPRLACAALAVVALAAARPVRAETPADAACFPACRSGYLCHESRCISACNPPCGAAEMCTATGECVPFAPAPPAAVIGEAPVAAAPAPAADPGWARAAFFFGAASVAADIALTAAVVATNPQEPSTSRTLGGWSIATFGITAPFTALGGGFSRTHPAVTGHLGLRVASWVGYALTMGGAAVLLAQSHHAIIKDSRILIVGTLGTLSTLGFTVDAYLTARQAEHLQTTGGSRPAIGLASGSAGGLVPTLGWAGTF